MQERKTLGRKLCYKEIDTGRVAARPGEAGDKTKPNRVFADAEDERDRRGRSFGRKRSRVAAGRSNNRHVTAH
jgi:hypothetical protein